MRRTEIKLFHKTLNIWLKVMFLSDNKSAGTRSYCLYMLHICT